MQHPDPIIPRNILWADPQRFLAKISPDGSYVAFLAPYHDNLNLWLARVDALKEAKPISHSHHPLRDHWWSKDNDHLLYIHDNKGDENWQLHGYQLSTQKAKTYTKQGCQARVLHLSAKNPAHILIGLNQRDKRFMDAYVLDLQSGTLTLVYENNRYWDLIANDDLIPQLGLSVDSQGGQFIHLKQQEVIAKMPLHDVFGIYYYPRLRPNLAQDEQHFYLQQSTMTNTSTLVSVELANAKTTALMNDPQADISDILLCPISNQPLAVATHYERKVWHAVEDHIQRDFHYLTSIDDGDIEILSQTQNNEIWLVNYLHDNGPITYYLYHRQLQQVTYLFNSHDAFKHYAFTKMHPRVITTRDGLKCVSYLSLPRQSDLNEKGIPFKPLPLVLMVHGGPNYRDFWGFNPTHQWLANRGYAVLSINYRASTGFGKNHQQKGNGEWAGKIRTDLLDAVAWAIENQITTKDKVAIMGRSFGGYSTLVGLSFTPDTYCCGVDIVGPSNLITMAKHFPPYWQAFKGAIHEMLGCDPDTLDGQAFLTECSPINYVDRITKPLLIGHGANDVRVLQEESDKMVAALQANHIPVTYALFPDEGHQFLHPGNRIAFYALAELFLAKNLNGRVEPYDDATSTSMVIKADDFRLYQA